MGGMSVEEAKAVLDEEIARRLEEPVTLTYRPRFHRRPRSARSEPTWTSSCARRSSRVAKAASSRARSATSPAAGSRLPRAARRLLAGGRRQDRCRRSPRLARPAREAKVTASFRGVAITPSTTGVAVRARALEEAFVDRLVNADGSRTVAVPARILKPKVTTKELRARYGHFIAISRSRRELRFFVNGRLAKTYRIGIGAAGFATPAEVRDREHGRQPGVVRPGQGLGGRPCRRGHCRERPRQSHQGPLAGLPRRRASTALPTRRPSAEPPRTAVSAC